MDGRWGNYFDGTGDYLTVASSADFNIFGGDMTVECWFYSTAASLGTRSEHLFAFVQDATNRESLYFAGTTLTFWTSSSAGNGARITYASTPQNQWIHVAVVKSGSTFTMYVNGVSAGTSTTTQYSTSNQSLQIGTYNSASSGGDSFTGYISNVRVVKGTAVYTGAFTPSTAPITAVTNTVLLTCRSNRFVDTNTQTTAKTVTPSGDVAVSTFSPFPTMTAYAAGTNGGSGYFDGSGDYLSVASNTAFNMGTGDFTIECWVYTNSTGNLYPTFLAGGSTWSSGSSGHRFSNTGATNKFTFHLNGATPGDPFLTSTNTFAHNSWNYYALTRSGNTWRMFINGVQEASGTYSGSFDQGVNGMTIGWSPWDAGNGYYLGYVSGLRITKGGALYTSGFTPPTSPPTTTVSSGTVSLLTNFTNGGIIDTSMSNDLETVGNAQISTTQSKFGGASMYFDGTGDYLIMRNTENLTLGTGDFTIEFWVYYNSGLTADVALFDGRPASTNGVYPLIYSNTTGKVVWYINSAARITATTTLSTGTWYHIAVARSGTSTKMFINGTQEGSTYTDSNSYLPGANRPTIGAAGATLGADPLNGYIDDLRVTKDYARYTSNFTAPTGPFIGFGD